ncbi:MAG: GRAS family protein, partial [Cyanobacteria bacterium P01_D01_bin.56]
MKPILKTLDQNTEILSNRIPVIPVRQNPSNHLEPSPTSIELAEDELAALAEPLLQRIAGGATGNGGCMPWDCGHNHNETVVNIIETSQREKPQLIELTEDELDEIAGGAASDDSCLPWECGHNHNETVVNTVETSQREKPQLIEITEDELAAIAGGATGDGGNCMPWECGHNHNEFIADTTNAKPGKTLQPIELSKEELETIVGGKKGDGGCLPWECGHNHNETVVNTLETSQLEKLQLIELTEDELAALAEPLLQRIAETQLFNLVDLIAQHKTRTAQQLLNQLLDRLNAATHPKAVNHLVFARAMAEHLSGTIADKANLYLQPYKIPQIQLFNLLASKVPLVSLVSELATGLMIDACDGRDDVTLIDIGIGTGRQMVELLHHLAHKPISPRRVHIIGIEPSIQSLSLAQKAILATAHGLPFEVTFTPFCNGIEDLDNQAWQQLSHQCNCPIINASFALHHICDIAGQDVRTAVLQRLHQLNPALIVLSEPNTDHL